MTDTQLFRMKPYIQPFERTLALKELQGLSGSDAVPVADGTNCTFSTRSIVPDAEMLLAYWESVGPQDTFTRQVIREASASIARNGVALADIPGLSEADVAAKIPRKRSLRYGTHGIHEYRGKFFPQLVRALINISEVGARSSILDPMCGSGTTLVEAATEGHTATGIDMNPLSVFVSDVKCRVLTMSPNCLIQQYESLDLKLDELHECAIPRPPRDDAYLSDWFSSHVIKELDDISCAISQLDSPIARDFYKVSLSNIIRSVSLQKEADLRVRREEKVITRGQALAAFRAEALRATKSVVAFLAHGQLGEVGRHRALAGDARTFVSDAHVGASSVDLVITSPPYATALPYLDTDRLSLIYLGLLPRDDHRIRDRQMIGNREVTDRGRKEMWEEYLAAEEKLPDDVRAVIWRIHNENEGSSVGFRRRNLPALLGRYFMDMSNVLSETHAALKPGAIAFFVVGNNRTQTAKGEVEIETAQLLAQIAESVGFIDCQLVSMEMLASRDLFSKNQTPSEHIIQIRKSEIAKSSG